MMVLSLNKRQILLSPIKRSLKSRSLHPNHQKRKKLRRYREVLSKLKRKRQQIELDLKKLNANESLMHLSEQNRRHKRK